MVSIATPSTGRASALSIYSLETEEGMSRRVYFVLKRMMDVVLAALLFPVLLPLMLFVAVLIKLDSPGPVLFVQERIGVKRQIRRGRVTWQLYTFPLYKFRSMVHKADPSPHQEYTRNFRFGRVSCDGRTPFKLAKDSRLTRLGSILRRTSIDELPQLGNVLKGEMSLVGPRPALLYEVALYDEAHYERFCAIPGITGWWQAKARSRAAFEEMIRMDIEYSRRSNLWLDLKIILLTVPAVVSCRGAD